ncbi:MAG: ribonuclease H-like domain-containing protein [Pseudomonadota bacterium]
MTEKIKLYQNDLSNDLNLEGDIAIDTETMGLNNLRDRLCLVQISDSKGTICLIQIDKNINKAPNLERLLTNPDIQKIFHFARFDVAVINHYLGIEINNIFCTKIASKLTRTYTDMHGLKELCRDLLGVQISKQQQSSDWGSKELTKEQKLYAASDVIHLHKLRDKLNELLLRENRLELAQSCFNFIPKRAKLDLAGWGEVDIFAH